jgi:hypothetical protein
VNATIDATPVAHPLGAGLIDGSKAVETGAGATPAVATSCAVAGCENFAEHMAGTDERLWCDDHCPDCNETENTK